MLNSEIRKINLPKGEVLEVQTSEEFYVRIRKHFGLKINEYVSDDYVRMFIYGSVKTALDKVG
jgi:hypothetical protein